MSGRENDIWWDGLTSLLPVLLHQTDTPFDKAG